VHTLKGDAALELTAPDSRTLWRGGKATVSGGVLLSNWTLMTGSDGHPIWETPWLRGKSPRQLFADDVRRPLTRSPVDPGSYHNIESPIWVGNSTMDMTAATGFVYAAADAGDTESIPAVRVEDNVTVTYFASYCTNTVSVAAVFPANRTVLFAGPPAYWSQVDVGARSRFHLDGVLPVGGASLAPGQWWVGRGMIRYAPLPGQVASRTTVVASVQGARFWTENCSSHCYWIPRASA
jgi:hypothetical protein